ncbi:MAG: hypothetical protein Q9219_007148 [cf. Caloplaca sp. 3 TL-2023]
MAEINSDSYMLGRDSAASARLNYQHYLWQQELQFLLHPSIPKLGPGAAIADIATGTGVWLLEAARQYPDTECLGLDISTNQCPPKAWVPASVKFDAWSFFEEPPPSLQGKFDIVHIRLIGIVIPHDPVPVIKNIAMLLKPNGYLQWEEMNVAQSVIATPDQSTKTDAIRQMDKWMMSQGQSIWAPRLAETLNVNGFHDAQRYDIELDMSLLRFYTDIHVLVWAEIAAGMTEEKGKKEFSRTVADVWEEVKSGVGYGRAKFIFVAQRDGF